MLVSPATPTTAFRLGEKVDDPLAMYLFDLCTLPLNLAGHCGMSVPSGLAAEDNLPVGLQIMAPALADDRLYRVGAAYETRREGRCASAIQPLRNHSAGGVPRGETALAFGTWTRRRDSRSGCGNGHWTAWLLVRHHRDHVSWSPGRHCS